MHKYKVGQSGVYRKCSFGKLDSHNGYFGEPFTILRLRPFKDTPYDYGQGYTVKFLNKKEERVIYDSEMQMNPARNIPWL